MLRHMIQRKKGIEKQVKEEFAKARKEVEIRHCHNLYNRMADSHPTHNWHYMKLRDKDTKKYLLTVFVATFVAYIIPAVVLYLGHFMGIMLTICISLFNLSMALLAWLWAKSVRKEFLLKKQIILNSLVTLLLIGIISLVVTNGAALSLSLIVFVWLGILNLLSICIQYAIYSFISKRTNSKSD